MAYFGNIQNVAQQERRDRFNAVNNEEYQDNPNRCVRLKAALRLAIGDDPAKAQEEVDAWLNSLQSRHSPLTLKPAQKPRIVEEITRLQRGEEELVEAAGDDVVKTAAPSEEELNGDALKPAQKSRIFEEITRLQRLEEDLVEAAAARGGADEMREFFKDLVFVKTALPSEEEIEKELNGEYDTE